MDYFQYKINALHCEDVPVTDICKEFGTPTYLYSEATFKRHLKGIQDAFSELNPLICYSVKACGNINILSMLHKMGSGFDVVSGGELHRVKVAGGDTTKVVFAGVGKTDKELLEAIECNIAYFNIESEAELENLSILAKGVGKVVSGALRVNPDVDGKTHKHTTTGKRGNKFGVDYDRVESVFDAFDHEGGVKLSCIHIHIGSPINTVEPYVLAIKKTVVLIERLRKKGYPIDSIIIGGGYGADYTTDQAPGPVDYAKEIVPLLKDKDLKLILEPGRSIAGNGGIVLTEVLYTKQAGDKKMVIVDLAMNDLIRPALYDAYHFVWPVKVCDDHMVTARTEPMENAGLEMVDIVGPICESVDFTCKDRMLPPLKRGDIIAVFTAGAYGFVMSSQYNARPRVAEVLVSGQSAKIIRKRETYDDLIALER
jgi:diaminopimelate decarboxylase